MELGSGRWVRRRLSKGGARKLRASRRLRIRNQSVGKGLPCSCYLVSLVQLFVTYRL